MPQYKDEYIDTKCLYYGELDRRGDGIVCKNGHFQIIPASTKIIKGNKVFCHECGTILFEVIEVKVTEKEIP